MLRTEYTKASDVPIDRDPDGAMSMEIARKWIYSDDDQLQLEAVELLENLQKEFMTEAGIRPLLILALLEVGKRAEAEKLLPMGSNPLENTMNGAGGQQVAGGGALEETLSRAGRMFRERAEAIIARSTDPSARTHALELYRAACRYYQQAYRVRNGHYPLVNLAELYLIKASLVEDSKRAEYTSTCHELAETLLDSRSKWPVDFEDDDVWHAATEAHANILLGNWDNAFAQLQIAKSSPNWKPFHGTSISKGIFRTIHSLKQLGQTIDQRFENPEALLGVKTRAEAR